MRDHVCLAPDSKEKRRRLVEIRHRTRGVFAIWALMLGGCTMTILAITVALAPALPL